MQTIRNLTDISHNKAIALYEEKINIYGTDGVLFSIDTDGNIYRALDTKANMAGALLNDNSKWLKVDLINNQNIANHALGAIKKGLGQILTADLKLNVDMGALYTYDETKMSYTKNDIALQNNAQFDIIDTTGADIETNKSEIDVTSYDNNGTVTALGRTTHATFIKFYITSGGRLKQMRGTVEYTSLNKASYTYMSEQIPNLSDNGLYFIGGILAKKNCDDLSDPNQARVIYASKLGESQVGSAGSIYALLKAPVSDIAELKAIEAPEDGEVRQLTDNLPNTSFYIFNTLATTGIAPDDGTTGNWNILEGGGKIEAESKTTDFTGEAGKNYLCDSSAGAITATIETQDTNNKNKMLAFKKVDNSINNIIIKYGADTLYTLSEKNQSVLFVYNDNDCKILSDYTPTQANILHSMVGRIVFQIPDTNKGIYKLDGSTVRDRLLAEHINANSSSYIGFTVDMATYDVTLPDWQGDILYGGGNRGLSNNIGDAVNQDIQSHNHAIVYTNSSSGSGKSYESGSGSTNYNHTQYSGGDYTRAFGRTATLCILGTTTIQLDLNTTLATPINVSFNGATVNDGDTAVTIYEGVFANTVFVDVPSGKVIDSVTNAKVTDYKNGIIGFQQAIGGGDFTVDVTFKNKPLKWFKQIDTADHSVSTSIAVVKTWDTFAKEAGEAIQVSYRFPTRNDNTSWGGIYAYADVSYDDGTTWHEVLNTGYDGAMCSGSASVIDSISGTFLLTDSNAINATSVKFRYRAKTYQGSGYINQSHDMGSSATNNAFLGIHCIML